jgi:hypothetical protein
MESQRERKRTPGFSSQHLLCNYDETIITVQRMRTGKTSYAETVDMLQNAKQSY